MFRKKRRSYKFTEKKHSKKAIVIWLTALLTLGAYLFFVFLSYKAAGQLSTYYGAFGVLIMLMAIVVMCLSFTTIKEEDTFQLFPRMAVVTSVLATLLWIGTYIGGYIGV